MNHFIENNFSCNCNLKHAVYILKENAIIFQLNNAIVTVVNSKLSQSWISIDEYYVYNKEYIRPTLRRIFMERGTN